MEEVAPEEVVAAAAEEEEVVADAKDALSKSQTPSRVPWLRPHGHVLA